MSSLKSLPGPFSDSVTVVQTFVIYLFRASLAAKRIDSKMYTNKTTTKKYAQLFIMDYYIPRALKGLCGGDFFVFVFIEFQDR